MVDTYALAELDSHISFLCDGHDSSVVQEDHNFDAGGGRERTLYEVACDGAERTRKRCCEILTPSVADEHAGSCRQGGAYGTSHTSLRCRLDGDRADCLNYAVSDVVHGTSLVVRVVRC